MILSRTWWTRVANAVRFLEDAYEALRIGKSVVLNFNCDIPWFDTMIDELEQECSRISDVKRFAQLDCTSYYAEASKENKKDVETPGEILLKNFCSEEERKRYWPKTYRRSREYFLSQSQTSTIRNSFVCVSGIEGSVAGDWMDSGSNYLKNFREDSEEEHGVFILVTKNASKKAATGFSFLDYSDYVTDYDCMMLCLTLLSPLPCNRLKKMYMAEIVSNITENNVEPAGELIQQTFGLAEDPKRVIKEYFYENGITVPDLDAKIENAVWEAQIRIVFPQIETFRRSWIGKYEQRLKTHLPITGADGTRLNKVSDLEITHLCRFSNAGMPGRGTLMKMRDARNTLAHIGTLSYTELLELKIF